MHIFLRLVKTKNTKVLFCNIPDLELHCLTDNMENIIKLSKIVDCIDQKVSHEFAQIKYLNGFKTVKDIYTCNCNANAIINSYTNFTLLAKSRNSLTKYKYLLLHIRL